MLTKLSAAGVLPFNSSLAIRSSCWRCADDAGSAVAAFVLAANATLLLLLTLFLCIRKLERARGGQKGGGAITNINMGGQYAALAKLGLGVLTCSTALDAYDARRDPASSAFVLLSYAVLVILTSRFLHAFRRAHAGETGQ